MEENINSQNNSELAELAREAAAARNRAAQQVTRHVEARHKEEVSLEEYRTRLYRSLKKDQVIVKESKEASIEKSLNDWKSRVGPTFAGATTDNPTILDRVSRLQSKNGRHKTSLAFYGNLGVGKAQPVSELVLTPFGFVRMGDLRVGDEVIGSNGKGTKILEVHPQGVRPIYRITFNDGSSTLCDEDHLWTVSTGSDRKSDKTRTLTTRELIDSGLRTNSLLQHRKYRIPMVSPVEFLAKDYIISPYILGALLGDGYLGRQNIALSSADDEILDRVRSEMPEGLHLRSSKSRTYDYRFSMVEEGGTASGKKNVMLDEIRRLGLFETRSHTKFIPQEYLLGSVEQRIDLLRGLMDTDGETNKNPKLAWAGYSTASEQLCKDIVNLVQSLGGVAKVKLRENIKGANHPSYRISVSLRGINPFYLSRKAEKCATRVKYFPTRMIDSIEYSHDEEAQCISVAAEDNLYVTRDYIVTHNTWSAYSFINSAIKSGAVTAGQIVADSETAILGKVASSGFKRAEMLENLFNPRNQIYFIDDVGQGYFSQEQGRTEVWFELVDHVYTHQLTLLLTTNKQFTERSLGGWIGGRAFDRLKSLVGADGAMEPGKVNKRDSVHEEQERKFHS